MYMWQGRRIPEGRLRTTVSVQPLLILKAVFMRLPWQAALPHRFMRMRSIIKRRMDNEVAVWMSSS